MTSNLGSDVIQAMGGEEDQYDQMRSAVMEVVGGHFRPEFINRIDEVVVFHPLGSEQIQGIAAIQLQLLNGRLAEQEMSLNMNAEAMSKLSEAGYDPVYGARPLKRAIQKWVENPLSQDILSGRLKRGDVIQGVVEEDVIVFKV